MQSSPRGYHRQARMITAAGPDLSLETAAGRAAAAARKPSPSLSTLMLWTAPSAARLYRPLSSRNGHIACSSCCSKMKKCHSCLCPIGPSRCLALENVIESIKVSCPFAPIGCREMVGYSQRNLHKQACMYSPCYCPISECSFAGSFKQLSHHFRIRHGDRAITFMYYVPFKISTGRSEPFQVLLAEDGLLFLLLNDSGVPVGNAVTITLVGPDSLKGGFSYQLTARSRESSIQIESSVANTRRWDGVFPNKDFLLIPQDFCGMQGVLCLDICVRNKRQ